MSSQARETQPGGEPQPGPPKERITHRAPPHPIPRQSLGFQTQWSRVEKVGSKYCGSGRGQDWALGRPGGGGGGEGERDGDAL